MAKQIYIRKASSELVPYEEKKVIESLQRAHVEKKVVKKILEEVTPTIQNGMSSKELYNRIYHLLSEYNSVYAAKYNLKQAIMALGPSGYPFEQFIGGMLKRLGYQTWTNQMIKGKCITHEIDIVAERNNIHYMIEAKYHNIAGQKTGAQDALYTQARFEDVKDRWEHTEGEVHELHRGWLITNTKLSIDAIQYANCVGLEVSSWDYPQGTSLRKLITSSGAHPITSLLSLTETQKEYLLDHNLVLCLDILDMDAKHIKSLNMQSVRKEAELLCHHTPESSFFTE